MNSKVRDRTKKELLIRKKEFLIICNVLDEIKIKYFLNTGILLGAIRNKDFIKWDWDVEISVFSNDFLKKMNLISMKLQNKGFELIKINKNLNSLKLDFKGSCPKSVTKYTIFSWNYSPYKNVYWRQDKTIPSKYLKKLSKIKFLGKTFNVPNNPKSYLKFAYNNWRTPLRTADKNTYINKNFKQKFLYKDLIFEKIYLKIRHLSNKIRFFLN
tara:strand:- start:585 stop:1223 length:639 start_codon:yes stop_codon:yes gene_type:complete